MAEHLTDEEQLENLKRWWSENGKSTVIAVVLAVTGYFGWEGWQSNQKHMSETAAGHYQSLQEALDVTQGQVVSDDNRATAKHLAETLKSEHQANVYASHAALFLAKMAVEAKDLDSAVSELEWVIERNADSALVSLSKNRLARVLISQEKYTEALAAVTVKKAGSFESLFAETRGDIYLIQGDVQQARAAYQLAQQGLPANDRMRAPLLAMKLDDLKTPDVIVESIEESEDKESGEKP